MNIKDTIILGDCLQGIKDFPDCCIDCCISSPPYWGLRDYEVDSQLGLEQNYSDYINKLLSLYSEILRVLKPTGTCFVNLGDTYSSNLGGNRNGMNNTTWANAKTELKRSESIGTKKLREKQVGYPDKSLMLIPERFAIGMIGSGWILRNQIIWHKPNQMPQSATDRFTVDFEKVFFFVKNSTNYFFEQQLENSLWANKDSRFGKGKSLSNGKCNSNVYVINGVAYRDDGMRNMRTVWSINTEAFHDAHFATYPEKLVERMIKSGCPENGIVLDPFMGAGTTAIVAKKLNRNYVGFEINARYKAIAERRLFNEIGLFL